VSDAGTTPPENRSPATKDAPRPDRRPAILGFVVWLLVRLIYVTLRVRFEHRERLEEAATSAAGSILVTWHGRTLIPANIYRKRGFWALISLSRDGEVQKHIVGRFGFQIIRGSTGRGGVRAALQLARKVREGGVLALTPDGPRGPSHKVQAGTIFLAQRAGCPVVPVGISAWPRKLLGSWDSYMLPMPFGRAAVVVGEPLYVAADLDEEGRQRIAEEIERALNAVEARAEEIVGARPPQ
jgi:lysophospholipid acyltransferase (LPLAT)-like uncharacterized protein